LRRKIEKERGENGSSKKRFGEVETALKKNLTKA